MKSGNMKPVIRFSFSPVPKKGKQKEGWMDGSMAMIVDRDSSD
jgi:hypothetical protein